MHRMARLRDPSYRAARIAFCLALGLSQGCYRSEPSHPADASASASTKQQLPFHTEVQPASASQRIEPAVSPDPKLATSLPFRAALRPRVLASGTLLTVQLDNPLSAATVHAGDAFAASVAAPVVLEGDKLIERGAEVTGRVEAAQSRDGSGYVQLTLSAITVDGIHLPLQTSSLFARGTVRALHASSSGTPSNQILGGIRVPKGRRLTFRLTAPVTLEELSPPDRPQPSRSSSE